MSIAAIDEALARRCATGALAGVVAMAAQGDEIIYEAAVGRRDASQPQPMTLDSVVWIASMTKAVTAVAAMQLVEQGRLSLDAPIASQLPELAAPQVLEGFDAAGAPQLRPARRPITLRHLLTHTAGFAYDMWNADIARYREAAKLPAFRSGRYAALLTPLVSDPGTRWEYSTSIDFAGRAVEAASGQRLDDYFEERIFRPLGMTDTAFRIRPDMRARLARVHARGPDGALTPIDFEVAQEPEFFGGGGGLYGTAADYIRFLQMLLGGGAGAGARLLKPETVALMAQNHIGDLAVTPLISANPALSSDAHFHAGPDRRWGLSFCINAQPSAEGRSAGSLAWAGLANTYYWIDAARDLCGVILMQVFPFADRDCLAAFADFERGIYDALDSSSRAA